MEHFLLSDQYVAAEYQYHKVTQPASPLMANISSPTEYRDTFLHGLKKGVSLIVFFLSYGERRAIVSRL